MPSHQAAASQAAAEVGGEAAAQAEVWRSAAVCGLSFVHHRALCTSSFSARAASLPVPRCQSYFVSDWLSNKFLAVPEDVICDRNLIIEFCTWTYVTHGLYHIGWGYEGHRIYEHIDLYHVDLGY